MTEWKIIQNPKNPLCGMTYEEVIERLKTDGLALVYVPEALLTARMCEIAIQQYGYVLRYVPVALLTAQLCEIAVQEDSDALQYVPEALRTAQLCEIAVQQDGHALQYVPDEHIHLFKHLM